MKSQFDGFERVDLGGGCEVWRGELPAELMPEQGVFDEFWNLHPGDFPEGKFYGKLVKCPRWQQAFGRDYRFSGNTSIAMPLPELVQPYLKWVRVAIDARLNGVLVNWYDGALGHYIGPHRDSRAGLVKGSPIATLSLGEER